MMVCLYLKTYSMSEGGSEDMTKTYCYYIYKHDVCLVGGHQVVCNK